MPAKDKYVKVELEKLVKEKEAIAVGFFSDLESSWAATKLFREVDVVVVVVVKRSWAATKLFREVVVDLVVVVDVVVDVEGNF